MKSFRSAFGLRCLLPAAIVLAAAAMNAGAQTPDLKVNPNTGETQEQFARRTKWWREAKFGMFIHWGVYSVPADASKGAEWYFNGSRSQVKDYEKFAPRFNPAKFDADKWVRTAKAAGMKYIVITSKHHDGFDMFDAKNSDYTIVRATPFKHDPMKDLAAACRKYGLTFCFYHSIMDWHHPEYLPRREWEKDVRPADGADLNKYIDYMKEQLHELLTNYGPIGGIWFDGGWEHNGQELRSLEVNKYIRSIQPNILINDRNQLAEDYSTPEQTIPANAFPNGRLWETCMTMNGSWGYTRDDHNWKSTQDLVQKLCDIASKGGNFLLNVGPSELGEFPPEAILHLTEVGKWMSVNSKSIYGTTKSPFKRLPFSGRATRKGNTLYLQVFQWPDDGLKLTGLKTAVSGAKTLSGEKLTVSTADGGISISKPSNLDPIATVVELQLKGALVVEEAVTSIKPDAGGVLNLQAADAEIAGGTAQLENIGNVPSIGYWIDSKDTVNWTVDVPAAGAYSVEIEYACQPGSGGTTFRVHAADSREGVEGTVQETGSWSDFRTETLTGSLQLSAGRRTVRITPLAMPHGAVMNLRRITLKPAP